MAGHVMRIASGAFVATAGLLSGCASSPGTHQLASVVADQRKAEVAYEKGNLAEALAGYEALTAAMPGSVDFWFRLGNIHVRMDHPDLAAADYEHALKLDSGNAKAWHNLGIVRMRQAAAAFALSARAAGPQAPELGKASAQMAHSLAALASPTKQPSPAPDASTAHDTDKGLQTTGGATP